MRYYFPEFQVENLKAQTEFQNKLGGLPWGIPSCKWPKCENCQKSLTLIAQFVHDGEMLNLGREGRVLNVMMCDLDSDEPCETWEGDSGANSCFILEPEELNHLSVIPRDLPILETEMRILKWTEADDDVMLVESAAFSDADQYFDLDEEKFETISEETKLGSVPFWLQSPPENIPENFRFVGQINSLTCGANFGDEGIGYIFLDNTDPSSVPKGYFIFQC